MLNIDVIYRSSKSKLNVWLRVWIHEIKKLSSRV